MAETKTYKLVATCAAGLSELVAEEMAEFGGTEIEQVPGAVNFVGDLSVAYRACLWSRFSAKILLVLKDFPAPDTDVLYAQAVAVDWSEHLCEDMSFAIDCTSVKSPITNSHFASLRVKDAIVDWFMGKTDGIRPDVVTKRPDVRINLFLHQETATLSIDLAGESLHQRHYRVAPGKATLKESLAAAILKRSGWHKDVSPDYTLLDPMCGTGTLLIEAAMMFGDIAPGLDRTYYGFTKWLGHDEKIWDYLVQDAIACEDAGRQKKWPKIIGFDGDRQAVNAALKNIEQVELEQQIHVERRSLAFVEAQHVAATGSGLVVVNPPYGERLNEKNEVKYLYRCLGRKLREEFPGWQAAVFTGNPDLADSFGLAAREQFRLYNGPLLCQLRIMDVPKEQETETVTTWQVSSDPTTAGAESFANRLRKNLKPLLKWAAKEKISCFRIYDGDIPEYNVAVDLYGHWVHIQEYAPPASVAADKAQERVHQAVKTVQEVLGIKRNRIFLKTRQRQRGKQQYQKKSGKGRFHEVMEGPARLLVNFSDYLDTGLFLDHRPIRQQIGRMAHDKRFLNLFAYTGSATIHAALGGATSTTSVDLSTTYLEWLKCNLALNGLSFVRHRTERGDCLKWLEECREQFDLIFVDPPTFSNTKKEKRVFDVQRDHGRLLQLAMRRLDPDGLLIFSTNFRRFKLEEEIAKRFHVQEISKESLPLDFARRKIHRCWQIRHR